MDEGAGGPTVKAAGLGTCRTGAADGRRRLPLQRVQMGSKPTGFSRGIGAARIRLNRRFTLSSRVCVIDLPALGGAGKLKAEGVTVSALMAFDGH